MVAIKKELSPLLKKQELDLAIDALKKAVVHKDYHDFYQGLKKTELLILPCIENDPKTLHQKLFHLLTEVSKVSIPVAVALSMHFYVLASIATFPLSKLDSRFWVRKVILNLIKNNRYLIANTGSVRNYDNTENRYLNHILKENGQYLVNFQAPFMSLSEVADFGVFTADIEQEGKGLFIVDLSKQGISYQDAVFGDEMEGSLTKSVKFENVEVTINESSQIRVGMNLFKNNTLYIDNINHKYRVK